MKVSIVHIIVLAIVILNVSLVLGSGCVVEFNANYPGGDIPAPQSRGGIPDTSACCDLCGSIPTCVSFAYYIQFQYCYLKSVAPAAATRAVFNGMNTGVVTIR